MNSKHLNVFYGVDNGCPFLDSCMTIVKADDVWPVDLIFVKIIKF